MCKKKSVKTPQNDLTVRLHNGSFFSTTITSSLVLGALDTDWTAFKVLPTTITFDPSTILFSPNDMSSFNLPVGVCVCVCEFLWMTL